MVVLRNAWSMTAITMATVVFAVACVGEDPSPRPTSAVDAGADTAAPPVSGAVSSSRRVTCPDNGVCTGQQACCTLEAEAWVTHSCTDACEGAAAWRLDCDDQTDCVAGKVCCALVDASRPTAFVGSRCQDTCAATQEQLCDTKEECQQVSLSCAAGPRAPAFAKICKRL